MRDGGTGVLAYWELGLAQPHPDTAVAREPALEREYDFPDADPRLSLYMPPSGEKYCLSDDVCDPELVRKARLSVRVNAFVGVGA